MRCFSKARRFFGRLLLFLSAGYVLVGGAVALLVYGKRALDPKPLLILEYQDGRRKVITRPSDFSAFTAYVLKMSGEETLLLERMPEKCRWQAKLPSGELLYSLCYIEGKRYIIRKTSQGFLAVKVRETRSR